MAQNSVDAVHSRIIRIDSIKGKLKLTINYLLLFAKRR